MLIYIDHLLTSLSGLELWRYFILHILIILFYMEFCNVLLFIKNIFLEDEFKDVGLNKLTKIIFLWPFGKHLI